MSEPRILVYDIEIIPDLEQAKRVWPQLSPPWGGRTLKAQVSSVLCIGYMFLNDKNPSVLKAWDYSRWKKNINDDYSILKDFNKILKETDCVVTHNGKNFDWKHIQTRFLHNGHDVLPKIHHADTKEILSKNLSLVNNKLDNATSFFLNKRKLDHQGWDLWVKCMEKCQKSLNKMSMYCAQDTLITRDLFNLVKPLAKIPNHNLFIIGDKNVCPNCGSTRLKSNGYRYTATSSYKRLICKDCGTWSRVNIQGKMPRVY